MRVTPASYLWPMFCFDAFLQRMKNTFWQGRKLFLWSLCLGLFCTIFAREALHADYAPRYASLIIDARTGRVLHQISARKRVYPASLTKIMTLYLTFEALQKRKLRLNQRLRVSKHAAGQEPLRLGLKKGQTITVHQAILGMMCRSANDCAVVLAEAIAGSERSFARRMTHRARALGMRGTTFRNASGLFHPCQVTTAVDMVCLSRALIKRFPQGYAYCKQPAFHFQGKIYHSTNKLLGRVSGVDGLKTGYIRKAGFNLVTSAKRSGRRLFGVVMGGKTASWRDAHMTRLIETGFSSAARAPVQIRRAKNQTSWKRKQWKKRARSANAPLSSSKAAVLLRRRRMKTIKHMRTIRV